MKKTQGARNSEESKIIRNSQRTGNHPQRRETKLDQLPIQQGFEGIQKHNDELDYRWDYLSIKGEK